MKILIDTNILISAALNPAGVPSQAFFKAVTYPNKAIISEQNLDELYRIFHKKFPTKINALESFLEIALNTISVVPTPVKEYESENNIRDVMDRPILRAAIYANTDVILTGDKDFLEADISCPQILTAAEFLKL